MTSKPIIPTFDTALDIAKSVIYGDREKTYGHPGKNLRCVAVMWQAYLDNKPTTRLGPKDVAVMMALLKTSRFANDPSHRDNVVDAIGYWALVERCDE